MKKALAIVLALVMCLSLCACGGGNDTPAAPVEDETAKATIVTNEGETVEMTMEYHQLLPAVARSAALLPWRLPSLTALLPVS